MIQRAFRSYLKKKKAREEQKRILEKHRNRWKKKIEGSDYVADTDIFGMHQINNELEPLATNELMSQEYEYRRRKDFLIDNNTKGDFFDAGNVQIEPSHDHRRRRFDDLKSVQDRKKEMHVNERLVRSISP